MVTLFIGGFITLLIACCGGLYWLIPLSITLIGILLPVEGFKEPKCLGKWDLIKLKNIHENAKDYYVSIKGKKIFFAYDNSEEYDLVGVAYEETYVKGRAKIYQDEACEQPILKLYVVKPSRELFAIAPFSGYKEYVFYIPEGTVYGEESRNNKSNYIV